jgi:hypothetical protein
MAFQAMKCVVTWSHTFRCNIVLYLQGMTSRWKASAELHSYIIEKKRKTSVA